MPAAPVILAASLGATLLGGAVSAYGAVQSADAQSAAAQYQSQVAANNATIAQQNATYATQSGTAQAQSSEIQTSQRIGAIMAGQASSGLDVGSGSPLAVRESQEEIGQLDAATIRNNAARQAYGYQVQAASDTGQSQLLTAQSSQDLTAGTIAGVSSILGGAASTGSKYADWMTVANNTPTGVQVGF